MGSSGIAIEVNYSEEEVKKIIIEYGGKVSSIAKKMGYGRHAIYEYLDRHPDLLELKEKAKNYLEESTIETAETVLQKLMQSVDRDPTNARQSAQFILKHSKKSSYSGLTRLESDTGGDLSDLAESGSLSQK